MKVILRVVLFEMAQICRGDHHALGALGQQRAFLGKTEGQRKREGESEKQGDLVSEKCRWGGKEKSRAWKRIYSFQ